MATKLTWIDWSAVGHGEQSVTAEVTTEKVVELTDLLQDMLSNDLVTKKVLRTVVGKATSMASVMYVWRPFIQQLYTACVSLVADILEGRERENRL